MPSALNSLDGFLASEWRPFQPFGETHRPFITISRQAGSGGSSLACLLGRKLNALASENVTWRIFEGNLIARMLEENHLPTRVARFLPEERIPEVRASIGELVGLHPNLWDLVQKTNKTIRQIALAGHAIFVGRGANFATADLAHGTHVRLVAPAEHRARYLAQRYNISESEARVLNARCDAARRGYVKANFGADTNDSCAYDMVINTAEVSLDEAADLVIAHIARHHPALEMAR
ncbi:MAG: cytidylate kinase-like family protein [Nibricoccus sp.]